MYIGSAIPPLPNIGPVRYSLTDKAKLPFHHGIRREASAST